VLSKFEPVQASTAARGVVLASLVCHKFRDAARRLPMLHWAMELDERCGEAGVVHLPPFTETLFITCPGAGTVQSFKLPGANLDLI
jgi:hypothetical protein